MAIIHPYVVGTSPLESLKENVLIGKLIPAGSGLMAYRDYQPGITPEARMPEDMIENALN